MVFEKCFPVIVIGLFLLFLGVIKLLGYKTLKSLFRQLKCDGEKEKRFCELYGIGILLIGMVLLIFSGCTLLQMGDIAFGSCLIAFAIGIITITYAQIAYECGFVGKIVGRINSSLKVKTIKYLVFIIIALNISIITFVWLLGSFTKLEFLLFTMDSSLLLYIDFVVFAICIVILSAILLRKQKNKIVLLIPIILSFCIVVCSTFTWAFTSVDNKYYEFHSPDGKHTVAVREWSFLLGGGVHIYERINPFFVKELGRMGTDDGYRAIEHNDYSIEWDDNNFTLTIGNGIGYGSTDTETYELEQK